MISMLLPVLASCQDHLEFYAAIRGLPKQAKWIEIYRDRFCRVLSGPFPSFPLLRLAAPGCGGLVTRLQARQARPDLWRFHGTSPAKTDLIGR